MTSEVSCPEDGLKTYSASPIYLCDSRSREAEVSPGETDYYPPIVAAASRVAKGDLSAFGVSSSHCGDVDGAEMMEGGG